MVITRTPFRISFFGGGTDYPAWYRRHGGRVLSTTIDKYCYISCRHLPPFFSIRHRVVWSHIETVQTIREILHPAVREGLLLLGFDDSRGLELSHQGDLPARTGIGSSSSFAVGLMLALKTLRGEQVSKGELADLAITLEQDRLKDAVGSQDQVAAAYGGFNRIAFGHDGAITVTPVSASAERLAELQDHLLLFYTGMGRLSSEVAADVVANIPAREEQLHRLDALVGQASDILESDADLDAFGALLDEGWALKRQLSRLVSNSTIDDVYRRAMAQGALGGKLLGAGTSGFILFYVPPSRQDAVRHELRDLLHVPFAFDSHGASLVLSPSSDPSAIAQPSVSPRRLEPAHAV